MATVTNRGQYQFQAKIRRKGYPVQIKTFETRRDAEAWARSNLSISQNRAYEQSDTAVRYHFAFASDLGC